MSLMSTTSAFCWCSEIAFLQVGVDDGVDDGGRVERGAGGRLDLDQVRSLDDADVQRGADFGGGVLGLADPLDPQQFGVRGERAFDDRLLREDVDLGFLVDAEVGVVVGAEEAAADLLDPDASHRRVAGLHLEVGERHQTDRTDDPDQDGLPPVPPDGAADELRRDLLAGGRSVIAAVLFDLVVAAVLDAAGGRGNDLGMARRRAVGVVDWIHRRVAFR
jgi:hypothetical protein